MIKNEIKFKEIIVEEKETKQEIIYEIVNPVKKDNDFINEINTDLIQTDIELEELNKDIENYTNHCDKLDYILAVCSGLLSGIIDSILFSEFDSDFLSTDKFKNEKEKTGSKINNIVIIFAKFLSKNDDSKVFNQLSSNDLNDNKKLEKAIIYLEKKFTMKSDKKMSEFGGTRQHHLRDFTHHFPFGMIFCIITEFTGIIIGTDTSGKIINETTITNSTFMEKVSNGVFKWFGHIISDVAGSQKTPGAGMGIPGPILSLAKYFSALPIFKQKNEDEKNFFSIGISKLFDQRFDLRGEISSLKKQIIPVMINEAIVRTFYFIRRLYVEIKINNVNSFKELKNIDIKKIIPIKNRSLTRMLTISTGVFSLTDIIEAVVRSIIKNKNISNPKFYTDLILRINFVGLGRFAIALTSDISYEIEKRKLEKEKTILKIKLIFLNESKMFYLQGTLWKEIQNTAQSIEETEKIIKNSFIIMYKVLQKEDKNFYEIKENILEFNKKNRNLFNKLTKILK